MTLDAATRQVANSTAWRALERIASVGMPFLFTAVVALLMYIASGFREEVAGKFTTLTSEVREINDDRSKMWAEIGVLKNNQDRGRDERIRWQDQINQRFKDIDQKIDGVDEKLDKVINTVTGLAATIDERNRKAELLFPQNELTRNR